MGGNTIATKLTYLVSHPIQYQASLLARIAAHGDINLRVVFERTSSQADHFDSGFGRTVEWDVPLREGYDSVVLSDTDLQTEIADADIVWLHGWQTPMLRHALMLARQKAVPVLMRGENCDLAMPDGWGPKGWLKRFYLSRIFEQCQGFLAIGTENENYYRARGVSASHIFQMPYAVDNDTFADKALKAAEQRASLKASLGIAPEQKVVLFAGKFQHRKRPDLLVQAMKPLLGDGSPVLVFVGSGDMDGELRRMAPEAIFTGFKNQSELPAFYDLADVFVLPSEREPWGLAVNEAMACGTAVIVSDQVGCAVDLIGPDCGRVFPAGDVRALTEALLHCLENADAMGKAATEKITGWDFDADVRGLTTALDALKGDA
ncbi:MAG: glycosyltransferase family 4 protein [Rhodospirillaceae bacterium]|nr:glycosyltransferase family 4 protein [Rhodospirillaceae bacterium]MBT5013267.1 glycosyltransferase family 4 protein [Rhodospirillaceae bacterium]MBT7356772.1 glycosyltransferase family 4 protein [Rhodospirillaceae bacterium]